MRNGERVVVVTLEIVNLKLPHGDYLSLEECYYFPINFLEHHFTFLFRKDGLYIDH